MNKNDITTVTIEDLTKTGEGIGHVNGYTLFVKDAFPEDVVKARVTRPKKTYAFARCEQILTASPDRVEAPCPVARQCGGCRLQEISYPAQLKFKEKQVRDSFTRIGGFSEDDLPMRPIIGMDQPWRYRNKAQYPIGYVRGRDGKKRLAAGFYAGRTHHIVEEDDCLLTKKSNAAIVRCLLNHMRKYHIPAYDEETGKGLVRHLLIREGFSSGQILVCPILNGDHFPHAKEFADTLKQDNSHVASVCFNINKKKGNVILGDKVIPCLGEPWIEDELGGLTFRISPLSFYQVNPVQTVRLYEKAVEAAHLTGNETVYDLYCGIGTISLFMARKAKEVYGVEIVPDAIRDAKRNAEINGIGNAHFYTGAAEDLVVSGHFDEDTPCPKADVIVVDPPRKGCDESLIDTMLKMAPERIVYVSCDPATLARDVRMLAGDGEKARYQIESIQPVDCFPQSTHVETVVLLGWKG